MQISKKPHKYTMNFLNTCITAENSELALIGMLRWGQWWSCRSIAITVSSQDLQTHPEGWIPIYKC